MATIFLFQKFKWQLFVISIGNNVYIFATFVKLLDFRTCQSRVKKTHFITYGEIKEYRFFFLCYLQEKSKHQKQVADLYRLIRFRYTYIGVLFLLYCYVIHLYFSQFLIIFIMGAHFYNQLYFIQNVFAHCQTAH